MALQGHDAQQIVGRIADIPAFLRMLAVGNPPQAEEAHHVIDPQTAGMPQHGPDRLDERLVGGRAELGGGKGRQLPVLAVGIEGVGRAPMTISLASRSCHSQASAPPGSMPIGKSCSSGIAPRCLGQLPISSHCSQA